MRFYQIESYEAVFSSGHYVESAASASLSFYPQSWILIFFEGDAVEVYNSKNLFGLANGRAKFEASKRGMTMVAGSDSHFADTMGLGG